MCCVCPAVIACAALAFLLTPLCQYVAGGARGAVCGRYSAPELAAALLAAAIVAVWVLTGHWLLMDGLNLFLFTFLERRGDFIKQSHTIYLLLYFPVGLD